jgi:hypothetical protein
MTTVPAGEAKPTLICDIEIYKRRLYIGFTRVGDGKHVGFNATDTIDFDRERLRRIMLQNRIVTYNGQGFDVPLIFYCISGATIAEIKLACDRIINGRVRYWDVEKLLNIAIPRIDHIDLIEPQPNAVASLKTLNGRLHGTRMQDLPYPPDADLTDEQWAEVVDYCVNSDIPATERLFQNLAEPIALREGIGAKFGLELRSKSDAQMGEAIIKRRVEEMTKRRVERVETPAGTAFPYQVPPYLRFQRPELVAILDRLRTTDFFVKDDGKVDLPKWLLEPVHIGESTYTMGIGGLHSTEKNRAVHADYANSLWDYDVASYYPAIILGSGLYPRCLGRDFLSVYAGLRQDRIAAKRAGDKIMDQGFKIALNGCFGKLGSRYSILYAPHLMIAVTLTGQLALLMLIERAEDAGIPVVSGNTDGVVFRCPRGMEDRLREITTEWERETGFELEATEYRSVYSLSVNTYIAVKPDGKVKRKGKLMNPHRETMRDQLMHNPNMGVCSDAVVEYLVNGTPLEETIRACTDMRDFVTVVNVKGGGTWRGEYLGKVVRYIWSPTAPRYSTRTRTRRPETIRRSH